MNSTIVSCELSNSLPQDSGLDDNITCDFPPVALNPMEKVVVVVIVVFTTIVPLLHWCLCQSFRRFSKSVKDSESGDNVLSPHTKGQGKKQDGQQKDPSSSRLAYGILDRPPWYLCIFLGIQHFLTALGGLVAVPLILAKDLCLQHDPLTQSYLISTIFFVSGICTLLQVFLGVRTHQLRKNMTSPCTADVLGIAGGRL
ncbi:hypothetical protein STEG23_017389, partial [Scotinomys teguina]